MTGILSSPRELRLAKAHVRQMDMEATPADKAMQRLIRHIKRRMWRSYEGYTINRPNVGEYLVHLRTAMGERASIRITAGGRLMWWPAPVFVDELFELVAAE